MKYRKSEYSSKVYRIPEMCFEDQRLSSFSGLVVIQAFFKRLELKKRLCGCFDHIHGDAIVGLHVVTLLLILHIIMGYRRLREIDRYKDDPVVHRVMGVRRVPDVSTVSRRLKLADAKSVSLRQACVSGGFFTQTRGRCATRLGFAHSSTATTFRDTRECRPNVFPAPSGNQTDSLRSGCRCG